MTSKNRSASLGWRGLIACAALIAATVQSKAQTAPADATTPTEAKDKEVLQLTKFEVNTTRDTGYVANNTATGFKTNQELIKIPQSVTVVTRDLIDDIGAIKTSDVLQFAGASQFYRGESIRLRGARIGNAYMDDAIENVPYSDNVNIDSYEVIRGPAGVLYPNASLGGIVLKSTKKPLSYRQDSVDFFVNDWGQYRAQVDATGPIGKIADANIGYRFVAAYQGGDYYLKNAKDDHVAIHPTIALQFKNTTVRFAYDYVDIDSIAGAQNFVLPNGKLYTGAGRDEGYYTKNQMENHNQERERLAIIQRLSDNWESKTSLSHLEYVRHGTNLLPQSLNLAANTLTLFARRNYQRLENYVLNQDFLGNYEIFGMPSQTAAGFTLTDEYVRAAFINATGATNGTTVAPLFGTNGTVTVDIAHPNMDSIVIPTYDSYGSPSSVGSWTNNRRSTYYVQEQLEIIPKRLIAVGGLSYATLQINDVPTVYLRNTAGGTRIVNFNEDLHRYGLVLNVTKDIALYGLDSTTFAPQSNSNTRDINGALLPAQFGKGKEVGIKTALLGGRISATLSYFDMSLTNVAVLQGALSPITGQAYFTAVGLQKQKGWDASVAVALTPYWQVMATAYDGTVKDQNGAPINNTYKNLYSIFTRYDIKTGALSGLSFGGGGSKTGGNYFSTPGSYTFPTGETPHPVTLEDVWNVTAFVTYKYGKNWKFNLNVSNVLDKDFALGAQSVTFVDMSPPRTFQFSTSYRF